MHNLLFENKIIADKKEEYIEGSIKSTTGSIPKSLQRHKKPEGRINKIDHTKYQSSHRFIYFTKAAKIRFLNCTFDAQIVKEMSVVAQVKSSAVQAINRLYNISLTHNDITVNETRPDFEGDYTIVLFAFIKQTKLSPDALGKQLGDDLIEHNGALFSGYNVIRGFLNLSIAGDFWRNFLQHEFSNASFGIAAL